MSEQAEFEFGCRFGPSPRNMWGNQLLTEMMGPNGLAVQGEDYCTYVVMCPGFGRGLVIQHEDFSATHIRLRDDVSNDEALRLGQALLQAIAAPPDSYDEDGADA